MSKEGWTCSDQSRVWHYFRWGRSLCRYWLTQCPALEPDDCSRDASCAKCMRKRTKELEEAKFRV